jgi:hypothetical protein
MSEIEDIFFKSLTLFASGASISPGRDNSVRTPYQGEEKMTGRRAIIGLSLLSALVFCAFAAPNAMAVKGTTAFTCTQAAQKKDFQDEHCKENNGGTLTWGHTEITPGTTTPITVTNNVTGIESEEKNNSKLILKGVIFGSNTELIAKKFMSTPEKTHLENKTNVSGQMEAAGINEGEFTEIQVVKPGKCTVKNVKLNPGQGATKVKQNAAKEEEMWVEFAPNAGTAFAAFVLEGAECALKEKTIEVTGTSNANVTTSQTKLDGPTLVFDGPTQAKTLKVGASSVEFAGTFTTRMAPNPNQENPITLTTTSS